MGRRDPAEFTEFAAARSSSLFRAAYLMVGDHGHAQDLLQEALTRTYVAWPRLQATSNAEAYARRVIANTAISWRRRRSWHERPGSVAPVEESATALIANHPDAQDGLDDRDWLWRELQGLPPRQRVAIVLRYYEDLTEAQTAEAMGCAVGTVKSQVAQGLKKLRGRIEPLPLTDEVAVR